jgi:hypothetical protein
MPRPGTPAPRPAARRSPGRRSSTNSDHTRAVAEPLDRRRHEGEGDPFLDAAIFWLISAVISLALRVRSLNGFRVKNTTPLFGVLVNCSGFRPGNATSLATPSVQSRSR